MSDNVTINKYSRNKHSRKLLLDEHIKKLVNFYDSATESKINLTGKKVNEFTFARLSTEALEYITLIP